MSRMSREFEQFREMIARSKLRTHFRKDRKVYEDYRHRAQREGKIEPDGRIDQEWLNNAVLIDAIRQKIRRTR